MTNSPRSPVTFYNKWVATRQPSTFDDTGQLLKCLVPIIAGPPARIFTRALETDKFPLTGKPLPSRLLCAGMAVTRVLCPRLGPIYRTWCWKTGKGTSCCYEKGRRPQITAKHRPPKIAQPDIPSKKTAPAWPYLAFKFIKCSVNHDTLSFFSLLRTTTLRDSSVILDKPRVRITLR